MRMPVYLFFKNKILKAFDLQTFWFLTAFLKYVVKSGIFFLKIIFDTYSISTEVKSNRMSTEGPRRYWGR